MMLIGALAPATAAADYAMAFRLAQLLLIPKHAMSQLLIPRLGSLMEKNKTQNIAQRDLWLEYDASRQLSLFLTLIGSIFFVLFVFEFAFN